VLPVAAVDVRTTCSDSSSSSSSKARTRCRHVPVKRKPSTMQLHLTYQPSTRSWAQQPHTWSGCLSNTRYAAPAQSVYKTLSTQDYPANK
jgi:hypothetical protein